MTTTHMTRPMRRSLEARLVDLDERIETLDAQRDGDDSVEATALLMQLTHERSGIVDALRDARLIDDDPFDTEAIEVGDTVTIQDAEGVTERYVLFDGSSGARARSDWVSVSSPLGAAIFGRSEGDRVPIDSPQGPTFYVVVGFERASEDSYSLGSSADGRGARSLSLLPSEAFLG
jgi:transcription elongation GreA/GreB family factor